MDRLDGFLSDSVRESERERERESRGALSKGGEAKTEDARCCSTNGRDNINKMYVRLVD